MAAEDQGNEVEQRDRGKERDRGEKPQRDEQRESPAPAADAAAETPFTQQVGRVVVLVVAIIFGVFAVLNVESVQIDWVFAETQTPLIVALLLSFALGAIVGWAGSVRGHRRSGERGAEKRQR